MMRVWGCHSNEVFGEWQAYEDDDLDPFEHWEQVQEQQFQDHFNQHQLNQQHYP